MRTTGLATGLLWLLCALAAWATAQEPNGAAPVAKPVDASPARIEEAKPPLFYLKDKQGVLQPVPGFTLEEFEQLYKLKHELAQQEQRPSFSLQRIAITGSAVGEHAELSVHVWVQVREEDWVRVPLRFDGGLLREVAEYRGPGEQFLHFEADGEGYVSWLRGKPGQQHELIMKMLVPLSTVRDETRFRLTVPRATSSEIKFKVPLANAVGRVSERATLQQTSPAGNGATEFTAWAVAGDFELAWRRADADAAETQPVLEASATILSRIDTRSVDSNVNLTVRSFGAPFDTFRVQLPPQCELIPGNATGYTLTEVPPAGDAQGQKTVEVRLPKKTSGPVEIQLDARRPPFANKPDQWTELAGFEVVGAARQWGTIAVTVMSDWQILWGASRSIRQTEQLPESLRRDDIAAAFDYFAQPFSLTARLTPKRTRIHVEPEYRISIDGKEARLDARLKFVIRGAKVFNVETVLPDWELEDVGPENIVATDGVSVGETRTVLIPLMQPTSGPVEIRLRARRAIDAGAKSVALSLPQPKANSSSPASVLVSSADHIELIPSPTAMQGLVREQLPASMTLADLQQPQLFYRSEDAQAVFAADLRALDRHIAVDVRSSLRVDEQAGQMEQRFLYSVAHGPTDSLIVLVPPQLAASDELEFECDGASASAAPEDLEAEFVEGEPVRYRVLLPSPVIGDCELKARFPVPVPAVAAGGRAILRAPLIVPIADRYHGNRLTVAATRSLAVEALSGPWSAPAATPVMTATERIVELSSDTHPSSVELSLHFDEAATSGATVVDRQWIQTWFTHSTRQDRFVVRFTTSLPEVELTLPSGAAVGQMAAVLNGVRLSGLTIRQDRVTIPLTGDARTIHVLDVGYHFADRPPRGAMSIDFPRLGPAAWVRRTYWQVVLPTAEHALLTPDGLISESTIGWERFGWGRRPLLDQADLEVWSAAPSRGPLSPSTNCYLFSALGPIEHAELRTAGRTWIVFIASALALTLAMLLIYVPGARHPACLLVLVALLGAAGLAFPEAALLAAQAAALGIVLGGLAVVMAARLGRRRVAPLAAVEPMSSRTRYAPSPAAAPASTRTAAIEPVPPDFLS